MGRRQFLLSMAAAFAELGVVATIGKPISIITVYDWDSGEWASLPSSSSMPVFDLSGAHSVEFRRRQGMAEIV